MTDFTFSKIDDNCEDCNQSSNINFDFNTTCDDSTTALSVNWSSITNLPSCFIPCTHTHLSNQITDLLSFLNNNESVNGILDTNSLDLNLTSKKISGNLKISNDSSLNYKINFQIKTDGLFSEILYADSSNNGILKSSDWNLFNNKFDFPLGTNLQYIAGDGTILNFPTSLPPNGSAGGDLLGNYPNPNIIWANGYSNYDSRYYSISNPDNYVSFFDNLGSLTLTNTTITSSDNIISAFGKTQGQLNSKWNKPTFTTGSVLFWDSTDVSQNNSKLFWDNSAFNLKLTDSKIQLLNTSLLGSQTIEYKTLSSVAHTVFDQTLSTVDNYLKIRCYNNTTGLGKTTGLLFGTVDGVDTTPGQVGLIWNSPNITGAGNNLLLRNNYSSSGIIKIQSTAYTQIDGLAIKQADSYTFSNSNLFKALTYPYNMLRFNYGGTLGTQQIQLPYDAFNEIPDGYIVILKALNTKGVSPNITVVVNGLGGQSCEPYTFTTDNASVIYRYCLSDMKWEIIAKN